MWLEYEDLDADEVQAATHRLLDDPVYSLNARRVAGDIAAMPTPVDVVPLVEEVARTKRPVLNERGRSMNAGFGGDSPPV